ncbi:MAG: prepilin-type N-terminal cleavage/methylation domain-containing protein [Methylococcales bacterium]|jgi:type IV pilus assembly protein PilW|nr:prepilin-type N-terminal cleavage/methylation domain-containing protein [Methylococcales bacterium]MBT7444286.1 prepilin-type N-terminal cleavage/methylation domain-containing protein [Methylococcales bacterium]
MKNITMKKATGFTLIELLVAMMLSIFLIGGVIQVFASNKRMYTFQEGVSSVQDNGRIVMHILSHQLRQAGYLTDIRGDLGEKAIVGCEKGSCPVGNSDGVTIAYQTVIDVVGGVATARDKNCLGEEPITKINNALGLVKNEFYVKDDNGEMSLWCRTNQSTSDDGVTKEGALISNIERLDIQYGLDLTGNDQVADVYESFSVGLDMDAVVTIRIGVLMASTIPVRGEVDDTTFLLPGTGGLTSKEYNTGDSKNDLKLRKMFVSTITVRNHVIQGALPRPGA